MLLPSHHSPKHPSFLSLSSPTASSSTPTLHQYPSEHTSDFDPAKPTLLTTPDSNSPSQQDDIPGAISGGFSTPLHRPSTSPRRLQTAHANPAPADATSPAFLPRTMSSPIPQPDAKTEVVLDEISSPNYPPNNGTSLSSALGGLKGGENLPLSARSAVMVTLGINSRGAGIYANNVNNTPTAALANTLGNANKSNKSSKSTPRGRNRSASTPGGTTPCFSFATPHRKYPPSSHTLSHCFMCSYIPLIYTY